MKILRAYRYLPIVAGLLMIGCSTAPPQKETVAPTTQTQPLNYQADTWYHLNGDTESCEPLDFDFDLETIRSLGFQVEDVVEDLVYAVSDIEGNTIVIMNGYACTVLDEQGLSHD